MQHHLVKLSCDQGHVCAVSAMDVRWTPLSRGRWAPRRRSGARLEGLQRAQRRRLGFQSSARVHRWTLCHLSSRRGVETAAAQEADMCRQRVGGPTAEVDDVTAARSRPTGRKTWIHAFATKEIEKLLPLPHGISAKSKLRQIRSGASMRVPTQPSGAAGAGAIAVAS